VSTPGATLHLMCGLPCSGKTTAARAIEAERSALRLSPDEWIQQVHGEAISGEALDNARGPMERVLWQLAERVLVLGVDVILDFGFWSLAEREEFRRRAARLGAHSELHFMDVPHEELRAPARGAERRSASRGALDRPRAAREVVGSLRASRRGRAPASRVTLSGRERPLAGRSAALAKGP
jgi:predicted kinase